MHLSLGLSAGYQQSHDGSVQASLLYFLQWRLVLFFNPKKIDGRVPFETLRFETSFPSLLFPLGDRFPKERERVFPRSFFFSFMISCSSRV